MKVFRNRPRICFVSLALGMLVTPIGRLINNEDLFFMGIWIFLVISNLMILDMLLLLNDKLNALLRKNKGE